MTTLKEAWLRGIYTPWYFVKNPSLLYFIQDFWKWFSCFPGEGVGACICLCFMQSCLDYSLLKNDLLWFHSQEQEDRLTEVSGKWRSSLYQSGSVKCGFYLPRPLLQIRHPLTVLPEVSCVPDSQPTHFWTNLPMFSGWLSWRCLSIRCPLRMNKMNVRHRCCISRTGCSCYSV